MVGAGAPKLCAWEWTTADWLSGWTAADLALVRLWTSTGRVRRGNTALSSTKNNQLRTGADKGNPTV